MLKEELLHSSQSMIVAKPKRKDEFGFESLSSPCQSLDQTKFIDLLLTISLVGRGKTQVPVKK